MKIGILGGGLTGLTIGYLLKQKDIDFTIIEKQNECGGLCKSIQEDEFTFDTAGGHILFSKDYKILKFILDILDDNKTRIKRNTKIFYKNNMIKYPFENGLSGLSKKDNFDCLNGFIKTMNKKYDEPKNFNEWIYQNFGMGIAKKYMIPYNEKIWNFKTKDMATFWVNGRIPKPPAEDIIKSSLGINIEGYTHQSYFYYPKHGGIQAIINSLTQKIKKNIVCNLNISAIEKYNNRWVIYEKNSQRIFEFDKIVSTMPIFDLIELINKTIKIPKDVQRAINNLKYNSLITVMLGLNVDKLNNLNWLYFPNKKTIYHRLIFPKNNTINTTPNKKSSIVAEITFNEGDSISKMSDKKIILKVINDLDKKMIIDKTQVCYKKIIKTKYAYVIYDLKYQKNIITVYRFLKDVGIDLCGRFSEYKYLNMDACIKSAMFCCKNIEKSKN